jgi:hypothetical protein
MKTNKNIKYLFFTGILLYSLSFIATKKYPDELNPCQIAIDNFVNKDTILRRYAYISLPYQDTVIISADTLNPYTINWNIVTDSLCSIYKNSCASLNTKILVINRRDTTRSNWDTRYGKKIYFKQCP